MMMAQTGGNDWCIFLAHSGCFYHQGRCINYQAEMLKIGQIEVFHVVDPEKRNLPGIRRPDH